MLSAAQDKKPKNKCWQGNEHLPFIFSQFPASQAFHSNSKQWTKPAERKLPQNTKKGFRNTYQQATLIPLFIYHYSLIHYHHHKAQQKRTFSISYHIPHQIWISQEKTQEKKKSKKLSDCSPVQFQATLFLCQTKGLPRNKQRKPQLIDDGQSVSSVH